MVDRRVRESTCIDCGVPITASAPTGALPRRCDECRAQHQRRSNKAKTARWRDANRERLRRDWNRRNKEREADQAILRQAYAGRHRWQPDPGLLEKLIDYQEGGCAICRHAPENPNDLRVDFSPSGLVRGLLCGPCYIIVQVAGETAPVDRLLDIARYLVGPRHSE